MGDVWIRDTQFGPATDSLKIAEHFDMKHKHILRPLIIVQMNYPLSPNFGSMKT
jgi:phage regulator Rha-like protein